MIKRPSHFCNDLPITPRKKICSHFHILYIFKDNGRSLGQKERPHYCFVSEYLPCKGLRYLFEWFFWTLQIFQPIAEQSYSPAVIKRTVFRFVCLSSFRTPYMKHNTKDMSTVCHVYHSNFLKKRKGLYPLFSQRIKSSYSRNTPLTLCQQINYFQNTRCIHFQLLSCKRTVF